MFLAVLVAAAFVSLPVWAEEKPVAAEIVRAGQLTVETMPLKRSASLHVRFERQPLPTARGGARVEIVPLPTKKTTERAASSKEEGSATRSTLPVK
ncbi:hypothetical protein A3C96_02530 [Candidatus Uhrbacteria bacterium RIFCSPHIGHO2_02_FULL_60_10]|uniref:DUF5666 domain-containing protein n=1 Tax=Candidatus Uhrbacteria bacterium RIFCSPHIGHO2_02_FULL_60_10 TaxID=1802392 RepID=A0A1F7U3R9_9BACT|nr:MAG: hypothetical protein A3C96_02530 [Candidatus Uhrbacteria bacterium RIFCSPHIGHO2_02_FULL_60_10]